MAYEPLHHKYRPQTFADLVGQEAIAATLSNAMKTQRIAPAYLLTGARGTGKTSTARIMAKSLNCLSFDAPTATPCGKCELCVGITRGNALDITEIDAASNTGVDNIRDLIERSQFAPVQARYKVYAIDECLTGDSLVQTNDGLMRIDDPKIAGKQALSYNENLKIWEFKRVLRWLDQGTKPTLAIKTTHQEIRCTENHLIRTDQGWIQAKNVKAGTKILSPVNVGAAQSSLSTVQINVSADLPVDISFVGINLEKNPTISQPFSNKLSLLDHLVNVVVEKNWIFQNFYNKKVKDLSVFNLIGKNIHTRKVMDFGRNVHQIILPSWVSSNQKNWDLSMAPYWEMDQLVTPINIVDFQGFAGHMEINNKNGWNIKPLNSWKYAQRLELQSIEDMGIYQSVVTPLAILNLEKFLTLLSQVVPRSKFLWNGLLELPQKVWHGGIWMMERLFALEVQSQFIYAPKVILNQKIKLLLNGLQGLDTQQKQNPIKKQKENILTTTFLWTPQLVENGSQTYSNIQSHLWHTNLETVESVEVGNIESVYDIEVEDNHNFVANGLLVHNCHMLSTAAFNALLKTLEEPPDRVVFILATTDPQRVLPTIISRCQRFDFRRIPLEPMVKHLTKIAEIEKIDINPEALLLVAQMSQGGLRDAESLLDQLSLHEGEINNETIWDLVGSVPERDLLAILEAIASRDSVAVIEKIRQIMDRGREPLTVLQSLAGFYRDLLIAKTAGDRSDLVALTSGTWTNLKQIAQDFNLESILIGQQHLRSAEVQIKNTTQPRLWLEVTLIGLFNQSSNVAPQISTTQIPHVSPPTSINQVPISPVPSQIPSNPTSISNTSPQPSVTQVPSSNAPSQTNFNTSISISTNESQIFSYQNLNEAWQQLVKYLSPPSKAVFVNKATFIEINDDHVVIGLKDKGLREIAIKKRDELEKCCSQIFNRNVKVQFRFISPDQVSTPSVISEAPNQSYYQASPAPVTIPAKIHNPETNNLENHKIPSVPELSKPTIAETSHNNLEGRSPQESEAIKNVIYLFDGQLINLPD